MDTRVRGREQGKMERPLKEACIDRSILSIMIMSFAEKEISHMKSGHPHSRSRSPIKANTQAKKKKCFTPNRHEIECDTNRV